MTSTPPATTDTPPVGTPPVGAPPSGRLGAPGPAQTPA